jgi:hypothetical protein
MVYHPDALKAKYWCVNAPQSDIAWFGCMIILSGRSSFSWREIHLQLNTAYYIFLIEINQLPKLAYNLSLPEGDKPTTDRLRLSEINLQSNSTKATSARENNHTTKPSYISTTAYNLCCICLFSSGRYGISYMFISVKQG